MSSWRQVSPVSHFQQGSLSKTYFNRVCRLLIWQHLSSYARWTGRFVLASLVRPGPLELWFIMWAFCCPLWYCKMFYGNVSGGVSKRLWGCCFVVLQLSSCFCESKLEGGSWLRKPSNACVYMSGEEVRSPSVAWATQTWLRDHILQDIVVMQQPPWVPQGSSTIYWQ